MLSRCAGSRYGGVRRVTIISTILSGSESTYCGPDILVDALDCVAQGAIHVGVRELGSEG